jgi:two-component system NtrC family response regulator
VLEYALAAAGLDPTLVPKHLPSAYRISRLDFDAVPEESPSEIESEAPDIDAVIPSWSEYRQQSEEKYLRMLLAKAGNSRAEACRLSGISQSRLYDLLKKHHIPGFRSS